MNELTEKGLNLLSEIRGKEVSDKMRDLLSTGGFIAEYSTLAVDFVFGSVWTRDGLERKQRSLVTMGILIANRDISEFKLPVKVGLTNGLTATEIKEAIIQAAPYAGFPAAKAAMDAAVEVFKELGIPMI